MLKNEQDKLKPEKKLLDFAEIPKDGTRFEQLVRELLLKEGLRPFWTGKGPDSGRDLIAVETLVGPISDRSHKWLVDCKHNANSFSSVGVSDVVDIKDRCNRVNADGFLLVTSTCPSSELVRKLSELDDPISLRCKYWDAVEIERRILTPNRYFLAQQFFPISAENLKWKLYYTEREERWIAHYKGNFLFVESRSGVSPPSLIDMQKIIEALQRVEIGADEDIRIRCIWHDTPNGPFYECCADYLVPSEHIPERSPSDLASQLDEYCVDGGTVTWHVKLQITIPQSDYYSPDDTAFYQRFLQPLYNATYGLRDAKEHRNEGWRASPPPVRTFNDQLIWNNHKEKHGFVRMGDLEVRTEVS